jgi:hypothetical protein
MALSHVVVEQLLAADSREADRQGRDSELA